MQEEQEGRGGPSPGSGIDESWFQWFQQTWIGAFGSVFGARVAGGAAAFLTLVIVGQELGPADFGRLAILLALMRLTADLIGPALDTTLIRFAARHGPEGVDGGLRYMGAVLYWKLILCAVFMLSGFALAVPVRNVLLGGRSAADAAVAPLTVSIAFAGGCAMLLFAFGQAVLQARQRFTAYAAFELLNALVRLAAVGWLLMFQAGALASIVGIYAATPLFFALLMWRWMPRGLTANLRPGRETQRSLFLFGKWVLAACLCTSLAQRIDLFVLGYFQIEDEMIGNYGAAVSLVLLGDLVVLSLFNVLLPRASRLHTAAQVSGFLRTFRWPTLAFAALLAPALLAAPMLTRATFGEAYDDTASIFSILFVGTLFTLGCAPATTAIYGLGRSKTIAAIECARLILTLGLTIIAAPVFGAFGVAWTVASVKGTMGLVTVAAVRMDLSRLREGEKTPNMGGVL